MPRCEIGTISGVFFLKNPIKNTVEISNLKDLDLTDVIIPIGLSRDLRFGEH